MHSQFVNANNVCVGCCCVCVAVCLSLAQERPSNLRARKSWLLKQRKQQQQRMQQQRQNVPHRESFEIDIEAIPSPQQRLQVSPCICPFVLLVPVCVVLCGFLV